VVPGLIGTPRPKDRPEPAHHLTHGTITGERGNPEDVAAMVRFLCSPAARYVTGQAIHARRAACDLRNSRLILVKTAIDSRRQTR